MTKDEALERKAENARELGLDYEPQPEYVAFMDVPHRPWVGLTDDEMKKTWYEMQNIMGWYSFQEIAQAIQAKLKDKNT